LRAVINEVECERLNLISKYPRELFLESLHLGLLDQVSEDSVIFHRRAHPYDTVWINTAIAYAELGKALKFQALDDLSNERLKQETMFGKSVYFLQWYSDNLDYQWIIRHQLKNIDGLSVLDKSVVFIHSVSVPEKVISRG
jgi:hypothetical protein